MSRVVLMGLAALTPDFTGATSDPTFTFVATDYNGQPFTGTINCSMDMPSSVGTPCTSPYTYPGKLSSGNHLFNVDFVDSKGNYTASSWSFTAP